jgi:hypothetical protein
MWRLPLEYWEVMRKSGANPRDSGQNTRNLFILSAIILAADGFFAFELGNFSGFAELFLKPAGLSGKSEEFWSNPAGFFSKPAEFRSKPAESFYSRCKDYG